LLIVFGYLYKWDWVGVGEVVRPKEASQERWREKTLWDWMQLLVVPIAVALATFALNRTATKRDEAAERAQKERDQAIAEQRDQAVALDAYLDSMRELILDRNLRKVGGDRDVLTVARALTLTVLTRLNTEYNKGDVGTAEWTEGSSVKRSVLEFLYESGLIYKEQVIVDLFHADLSYTNFNAINMVGANLSYAQMIFVDLRRANLNNAYLRGTYMLFANLSAANLSNAFLSHATLNHVRCKPDRVTVQDRAPKGVNLAGANLFRARLIRADLSDAILSGADLSGADLSGASVTKEQLGKCKTLKGVSYPDELQHD
jgi:hypothetical protein